MLIKYKNIVATIAIFFAIVIMFALGVWQLERKAEKEERLAQIAHRQNVAKFSLLDIKALAGNNKQDYPMAFAGMVDTAKLIYIDNKIVNGQVGYHIIAPVRSKNEGMVVLVNFGWVKGNQNRTNLVAVNIDKSINQYSGLVQVPSKNIMITETTTQTDSFPIVLQQIDIPLIQQLLNVKTEDFILLLDDTDTSDFIRQWQPVVMPPEKHLAYAVQWFGLAVACLTMFLITKIRKGVSHRDKSQ